MERVDAAVHQLVAELGCRVDIAANGREALQLIRDLPYDLVFMDCEMPEMDGYTATIELRKVYEQP